MSRQPLALVLLLALAAISGWWLHTLDSALREEQAGVDDQPVLTLRTFHATRMDAQGLRRYTLSAPWLEQRAGDAGIWVEAPEFDTYRDGHTREWLLRARQGWLSPDHSRLVLTDTVTMTRPAESGLRPVTITTRDVTVYPREARVHTDAPALLEAPGTTLRSVGFTVFVDEDRLELTSAVRGRHEPAHHH